MTNCNDKGVPGFVASPQLLLMVNDSSEKLEVNVKQHLIALLKIDMFILIMFPMALFLFYLVQWGQILALFVD